MTARNCCIDLEYFNGARTVLRETYKTDLYKYLKEKIDYL